MSQMRPGWIHSARKLLWATRTFGGFAWENQLCRFLPEIHDAMKRRGRRMRPGDAQTGLEGARYFRAVADDYQAIAERAGIVESGADLWRNRHVLELGPGDTRALAWLARVRGALSWDGVDPFDIESRDDAYARAIYAELGRIEGQPTGEIDTWLQQTRLVRRIEDLPAGTHDLVISRSVLEHVHQLDELFATLARSLHPSAAAIHKIDLRCHDTRFDHELDFLLFPPPVYALMASHLDLPNRVRAPELLAIGPRYGFAVAYAATTHLLEEAEVARIRERLPRPFSSYSARELAVLGLWLVLVGPDHPARARCASVPKVDELGPAPLEKLSRY